MTEKMEEQMSTFDRDTWCGKMCQEPLVREPQRAEISDVSSKKRQKWQKGMPAFLDLRNGHTQDASWEMGGLLLGDYTMHSFGESPSEEKESLLSQILEEQPHPKYYLSAKACQGILRRAEKRGKELPKMLKEALEKQSGLPTEGLQPLRAADGGDSTPKVCYRKTSHAKSKEDGQGWQETEVNDTLNIFDNGESRTPTVIVEVAQPLRAADGGDSTSKVVCIEGNGSRPSHRGDGYSESETMYTLNSTEHHAVCAEPMVMEEPYNATTGSFMRDGNSGIAETLATRDYKDPQIVCNSVVRRLTPLECERLQGYSDGWTDIGDWVDSKGKKHKGESDSPRYKALGNSIALPFWKWMAKRMRNYLGDNPTMASLFDGIGGFPLSYQEAGVKPIWASEIEEFPIAVTKIRFPEENK